jgi:uncharacterized protein YkwD
MIRLYSCNTIPEAEPVMENAGQSTDLSTGIHRMRAILSLVFASLPGYAVADVIELVNGVRVGPCRDSSVAVAPFRHEQRLDDAARRIADGADLEAATSAANYPARLSASIRVRSVQPDDGFEQTLAHRFCDVVGDARLAEIGYFEHGAEVWLVFASPFAPAESADPAELYRRVLQLINEARLKGVNCGDESYAATTALQENAALKDAAQSHAEDMATHNFLGHGGSSGSLPGDRAKTFGYAWSAIGENVAAGQSTAEEVVDTWLASASHCENLMSPAYSQTGIAHSTSNSSDKGIYWVQLFGHPQ